MFQKIKNVYHLFVSICANFYFQFPGKKIKVVGITGTDGKTTTASIIYHILKNNGKSTSLLTSLGAEVGGKSIDTGFHVTTPSPFALQEIMKKAVDKRDEYFVLEVTSHAIDQFRIWGIPFEMGVLTNISNEHLDYHKTFENYANTKYKLLESSKISIINKDDLSFKYFEKEGRLKNLRRLITYGMGNGVDVSSSNYKFESKELVGDFNKSNTLAAIASCMELGLTKDQILKSLKSYKMPKGRFDYIYEKDFSVLIDFAHTPKAFKEVLNSIRPSVDGKIIHVFGAAGERDKEKRPMLGLESSKHSDVIILTAEDPRSEDASIIINEIASEIKANKKVLKIEDRKKAIQTAIEMAESGDLVLLTGKSHEKSMTFGKKEEPWDEYAVVKKAINEKNK